MLAWKLLRAETTEAEAEQSQPGVCGWPRGLFWRPWENSPQIHSPHLQSKTGTKETTPMWQY